MTNDFQEAVFLEAFSELSNTQQEKFLIYMQGMVDGHDMFIGIIKDMMADQNDEKNFLKNISPSPPKGKNRLRLAKRRFID